MKLYLLDRPQGIAEDRTSLLSSLPGVFDMPPRLLVALLLLVLWPSALVAQEKAKKAPPERPAPTIADYAYAHDHERQKFDFWQAKSEKPTPVVLLIHGGGWRNGD